MTPVQKRKLLVFSILWYSVQGVPLLFTIFVGHGSFKIT